MYLQIVILSGYLSIALHTASVNQNVLATLRLKLLL